MPIHPRLQEIINVTREAHNPPLSQMPLEKVREGPQRLKLLAGEYEPVAKVINEAIVGPGGNLLIRLYYPETTKPLSMLLYFHPGGFVKGDIDTHDPICHALAHTSGCLLISVNYRLAPENPYPAQIEDGYAALEWIATHANEIGGHPEHIAVGGESSGANLATVLTHLTGEKKGPKIAYQVLVYPQTDYTNSYPSHETFKKGYLLEEESLNWYASQYIPEGVDRKTPYLSPLWATNFTNLPPAFVITAEFDPLRDEGEAYAKKLMQAAVPAKLHRYKGMIHGFVQMGGVINEGKEAIEEIGKNLRKAFQMEEI